MLVGELCTCSRAEACPVQVWQRLSAQGESPNLVIGSDTVVAHNGHILEKPKVTTRTYICQYVS